MIENIAEIADDICLYCIVLMLLSHTSLDLPT